MSRPETPRNRLVRQARESLAVARYFRDAADEQRALNRLAALGVDDQGQAPLTADDYDYAASVEAEVLAERLALHGAPAQASANALAVSLWAAGEAAGDPWALAQGVPVGRGAAPLSGPCCEEPAQ